MIEREKILMQLPAFNGTKKLIIKNQTAFDIINELQKAHNFYKDHYDKISLNFWRGDLEKTAKYLFDWCKKNIHYSIEPDSRQSVKSPAGIVATGIYKNGFNDCKHYSQFIAGVLDALKRKGFPIDWKFRFANYRWFTNDPQHVFVVANDGKKEYWIDPVLKSFNERKGYLNKIDKKPTMSLYKISGVNQLESIAGSVSGKRKKGGFIKKVGKGIKKKFQVIKKISFAPSRLSFIALLKLNPFKMANNLNAALDNPAKRGKLLKAWQKIGGNTKTFEKLIRQQYQRWKKRKGISGIGYVHISGVGFVHHIVAKKLLARQKKRRYINQVRKQRGFRPLPVMPIDKISFNQKSISGAEIGAVQLVALLAAAAPIIALLAEFLPKGMKNKSAAAAREVPEDQQKAAVQSAAAADPGLRSESAPADPLRTVRENNLESTAEKQSIQDDEPGEVAKSSFGIDPKVLLGIAGSGALLYFITKKK